jgi:ankyrin repeat protein
VKIPLPTRKLPVAPDLAQLKHQAKELLKAFRAGDPAVRSEVATFFRDADPETFALHDAQLALARSYGYDSWPKLKAVVDGVTVQRLLEAVRANDAAAVTSVLKIRPELVNAVEGNNYEYTALHHAVIARNAEMVRTLMRLGADARMGIYPNTDATSAMTIAGERGYDDMLAILREEEQRREAVPLAEDATLLELRRALQGGDEQGAIGVLERHPELAHFVMPGNRRTVLHLASAVLMPRAAAWLLDHGADPNARASNGSTPVDVAGHFADESVRAERSEAVLALLLSRGAVLTPRAAVMRGDLESLRQSHKSGALESVGYEEGGLLRVAVDCNRPDILALLLDYGLDPDARVKLQGADEIAYTWGEPLYQCARNGKHAMARILLERGADPNAQVYASGTPLSEAFGQRDEEMIELLVQYGGKPNPSMAGLYRRKDLAEKLLAEYGDTKLEDDGFSSGTVAEQLIGGAARGGDPEILRMGMERVDWPDCDKRWYGSLGAPLGFWNHWYGPWCHQEWDRTTYLTCFKMLLAKVGKPEAQQRFGTSILHLIVTMGGHVKDEERVAFAEAALDAGAPLRLRDKLLASTPLGWACRWGREDLARLFLDYGADPREEDAEPWATPLAWAEKKGHAGIAAMLRERIGSTS